MSEEVGLALVDGRDALAWVILRPGPDNQHVMAEAGAKGITKGQAAAALRQIADKWDAEEKSA
jgi:hypothetical protein